MTNQEAIELIKVAQAEVEWNCPMDYAAAFDLAIKALEQEPCEDYISRQAVDILVDELARAISDERCCMSRGRSIATIMQDILDLSSVTPQPKTGQWIPRNSFLLRYRCSECEQEA